MGQIPPTPPPSIHEYVSVFRSAGMMNITPRNSHRGRKFLSDMRKAQKKVISKEENVWGWGREKERERVLVLIYKFINKFVLIYLKPNRSLHHSPEIRNRNCVWS